MRVQSRARSLRVGAFQSTLSYRQQFSYRFKGLDWPRRWEILAPSVRVDPKPSGLPTRAHSPMRLLYTNTSEPGQTRSRYPGPLCFCLSLLGRDLMSKATSRLPAILR